MSHPPLLQRLLEAVAEELRDIADESRDASGSGRVRLLGDLVLGRAILEAEDSLESAALDASVERLIPSIGDPAADEELHRLGHLLLERP